MNKQILLELFEKTSKYCQPRKESLHELRDCYEKYSNEYISAGEFLKQLHQLGFESNKSGEVKLKMKKHIRKMYFMPGSNLPNHNGHKNPQPQPAASAAIPV
jgi:hypothetical protein